MTVKPNNRIYPARATPRAPVMRDARPHMRLEQPFAGRDHSNRCGLTGMAHRSICCVICALGALLALTIGGVSAQSEMQLIGGRDKHVCLAVQKNTISGVPFPLSHAVLPRPCWRPIPGLARIDVDNDGYPDNLIRVTQCFRSCEWIGFAVIDETRTQVSDSELNKALQSIGGGGCGPHVDVFSYEGRTYVEAREPVGDRTVFLIMKDKPIPQKICVFQSKR